MLVAFNIEKINYNMIPWMLKEPRAYYLFMKMSLLLIK